MGRVSPRALNERRRSAFPPCWTPSGEDWTYTRPTGRWGTHKKLPTWLLMPRLTILLRKKENDPLEWVLNISSFWEWWISLIRRSLPRSDIVILFMSHSDILMSWDINIQPLLWIAKPTSLSLDFSDQKLEVGLFEPLNLMNNDLNFTLPINRRENFAFLRT